MDMPRSGSIGSALGPANLDGSRRFAQDMGMAGGQRALGSLSAADAQRKYQEFQQRPAATKQGMGPGAGLEKFPANVGGRTGIDQSVTGRYDMQGGGPQGKAMQQMFDIKGKRPPLGKGLDAAMGGDWQTTGDPMGGARGPVDMGSQSVTGLYDKTQGGGKGAVPTGKGAFGGMLIPGSEGGALGPVNPGDSLGAYGDGKGAVPTGKGKPGAQIAIDPNMPTGGALGPVTPGGGPGAYGGGAAGSPTGGGATGGNTTGGETDLDAMYKQVGDARKAALDAAMLNQQQAIAAQGNALGEQYDDMRGQAYANARISALGNNERMAATGLAGAANAGPQSGYSESSRVAQDTALGNALNAANRQEQSARDDLATQGNSARLGRDQQLNSTMADLEQQKIQDKMRQDEFGATMEYNKQRDAQQQKNWESEFGFNKEQAQQAQANWDKQFGESQRQFAEQMGLSRDQFEQQKYEYETNLQSDKEARALDNAWKSISVTGKVSAEAAKLLGIPEGTSSMEAKAMAMEQAKAEVAMFGRVKTKMTAALLGVPIGTKRR